MATATEATPAGAEMSTTVNFPTTPKEQGYWARIAAANERAKRRKEKGKKDPEDPDDEPDLDANPFFNNKLEWWIPTPKGGAKEVEL